MNDLFWFAAHNTVAALIFALFVSGLTRVWRNPPVAHVLWLLVLLKLMAPPLLCVDWSTLGLSGSTPAHVQAVVNVPRVEGENAEIHPHVVDHPTVRTKAQTSATTANEHDSAASIWRSWNRVQPVLLWFWLGGAALCSLVATIRIVRFDRLLRGSLPASERLQRLTVEISTRLGVRRAPDVRLLECSLGPFVLWAGHRPTIVLPMRMLRQADDQSSSLILAHELAHLRRRDHWVRIVELFVSTVYWWNPLVWVVRRQIHQAEDLCCDAWVRWAFPDCTKRYAEVLLETAESLRVSQVDVRLLLASPFLRSLSLKARIEMVLESRFAPYISRRSMFVIAALAFLVLPLFVQTATREARAVPSDEPSAQATQKPKTPATSEFPYAVKFEQGATRFQDGDEITIVEVRGTADTFASGNLYLIKGTYTVASHSRAKLSASITAMDAEHGRSTPLKVQSTVVNQGDGTFTLFLPMAHRGWPHVSFYPTNGGGDFGGNYFGTGDSVLKRWWGSKE
jgi:beta-lactamase regulating signal transducer with metallopeptidase domain